VSWDLVVLAVVGIIATIVAGVAWTLLWFDIHEKSVELRRHANRGKANL
jgi:hypothetical protein